LTRAGVFSSLSGQTCASSAAAVVAAQQHLLSQAVAAAAAAGGASITCGTAPSSSASGNGNSGSSAIPVQHLLIPVSIGNGLQQLISIPLSLAAGAGNHIQLLATSNGHLIATAAAAAVQRPAGSSGVGTLVSVPGTHL